MIQFSWFEALKIDSMRKTNFGLSISEVSTLNSFLTVLETPRQYSEAKLICCVRYRNEVKFMLG